MDKSTLFRTLTLFLAHHWCTASTTVPVRSNMRFAAAIAIVKSTTCIPISIARIAGVPFACEGWLFRRWACRTDFRPKRSISLSRGSAPTVRGGTDRRDRGGLPGRRSPVRPGRRRSIKGPGISGAPFPQRMSAAGGEPVADQRRAAIRNAGFGVELHAVYRQIPVIKGHDVPRFIVRTCDQLFGHRVRIDDPRMVASYDQGRSDFLQQQIAASVTVSIVGCPCSGADSCRSSAPNARASA